MCDVNTHRRLTWSENPPTIINILGFTGRLAAVQELHILAIFGPDFLQIFFNFNKQILHNAALNFAYIFH